MSTLLLLWLLASAPQKAKPTPKPTATPAPPTTTVAPAPPAPSPSPSPSTAPEYRVGPGDILEVTVLDNEEVSRIPTVQTSGVIALPLLGEVEVTGLTVAEIQRKLTTLLARDYLVNPQVEVKVKDYQSQFVTVVGEVNTGGRKPLRGRTRLVDLLVEAGGFTPRASGDIMISRQEGTFDGGAKTLRMSLSRGALTPQDQVNLEVVLKNGDVITALQKYYVTVEGEVNRPGRYPIEGELTVTGAVSTAGGLTRFGGNDVRVRRVDPQTGQTRILEVDLKDVRSGKKPDPALLPNDVVTVTRRLF
jgi:polysaccharide export outer membrane protein